MEKLAKDVERYLAEVTGLEVTASPMTGGDLPYFFSRQYGLYHLQIGNTHFNAVFLRESGEFKPALFLKHLRQTSLFIDPDTVCVVAQTLPTYVRKRLIERRIAFVLPKVQMYIPALGMELRSRAGQKQAISVERYSPATQVVVIHGLLGRIEGAVSPLELSKQLQYSAMSMTRALDECESTEVAQVQREGRERLISFPGDPKELWQKVQPRLRNPVGTTVRVLVQDLDRVDVLPAGIMALSAMTMLGDSPFPEYAVSKATWCALKKNGVMIIPVEEPDTCLLQVWHYDPKVLALEGQVDPFSLSLSLQEETDERIEMAIKEMMDRYYDK